MSCAEASEFERRFFARGGFGEREAIRRAGRGIAEEFLREFDIGNSPRIIAIAGGGHNGADAIARLGFDYRAILRFYYRGAELTTLDF